MNLFTLTTLLALSSPAVADNETSAQAVDREHPETHVLIIGIQRYFRKDIPEVMGAEGASRLLYDFFESRYPGHVTQLIDGNATAENIDAAHAAIAQKARPGDTVVVIWNAHSVYMDVDAVGERMYAFLPVDWGNGSVNLQEPDSWLMNFEDADGPIQVLNIINASHEGEIDGLNLEGIPADYYYNVRGMLAISPAPLPGPLKEIEFIKTLRACWGHSADINRDDVLTGQELHSCMSWYVDVTVSNPERDIPIAWLEARPTVEVMSETSSEEDVNDLAPTRRNRWAMPTGVPLVATGMTLSGIGIAKRTKGTWLYNEYAEMDLEQIRAEGEAAFTDAGEQYRQDMKVGNTLLATGIPTIAVGTALTSVGVFSKNSVYVTPTPGGAMLGIAGRW